MSLAATQQLADSISCMWSDVLGGAGLNAGSVAQPIYSTCWSGLTPNT